MDKDWHHRCTLQGNSQGNHLLNIWLVYKILLFLLYCDVIHLVMKDCISFLTPQIYIAGEFSVLSLAVGQVIVTNRQTLRCIEISNDGALDEAMPQRIESNLNAKQILRDKRSFAKNAQPIVVVFLIIVVATLID